MKLLAIGNSFSEDATAYLHQMAEFMDIDLQVTNLYIGGCSLETHANNLRNNLPLYRLEKNGLFCEQPVALGDIIKSEDWDVVTIQQVSSLSGKLQSYYPFANILLDELRRLKSNPKIYFHQTWAYEIDSDHGEFSLYNNSQSEMYNSIVETSHKFCKENNLKLIPSGEAIQEIRKINGFDYENGGESLCRDGFHMSLSYGRYAVALVWLKSITGADIRKCNFYPKKEDLLNGISVEKFDFETQKAEIIKKAVHTVLENYLLQDYIKK